MDMKKDWMECTKEELCDAIAELSCDLAAARLEIDKLSIALAVKNHSEFPQELRSAYENEIAAARRECAEMRAALEFYRDEWWQGMLPTTAYLYPTRKLIDDHGDKARRALLKPEHKDAAPNDEPLSP